MLTALLAACGNLPRPFQGSPGATAVRLAQPPPARLAVPAPTNAMLPDAAGQGYAEALVAALLDREIPAVAEPVRRGDWSLSVTAELRGDQVVPSFAVMDPSGLVKGVVEGAASDAQAWSVGALPALQKSAAAAAPNIATLLAGIEAERQQSDPNSLANRPARVVVRDVTGARGDGNAQLARQVRLKLPQIGEIVQESVEGADFIVEGQVRMDSSEKGTERVEAQWIVSDARGGELGRVVQLNDIPPGSLDAYWGDVAAVVAQEAAGGIRDIILKQHAPRASASAPPAK